MPGQSERIEGGIVGLLVGDALGVPYEFHPPEEIPPISQIEYVPPPGFNRAHAGVPPGTWSDDGAQALVLLSSLLERGCLDVESFGKGLVKWYRKGYMAVDRKIFDIGLQTSEAIKNLISGVPALDAGRRDEAANGNGSLMRVLPLALWHKGTDEELVNEAHRQSRVTHGHPRSQICCALYCLWARRTLQENPDPWRAAVLAARRIYGKDSVERLELEESIRPDDPADGRGTGYVVDCLRSARWALQFNEYEQVVKASISLGNDTDTTACVAGGIAGIRGGVNSIPIRWREGLRGRVLHRRLARRLAALNDE